MIVATNTCLAVALLHFNEQEFCDDVNCVLNGDQTLA